MIKREEDDILVVTSNRSSDHQTNDGNNSNSGILLHDLQQKSVDSFKLKRYSDCIKYLNRILIINPNDVTALSNRALCNYQLELYKHCIKDCDMALTINPTNKLISMRKAMACKYVNNMNQKSLELFQNATGTWGSFEEIEIIDVYWTLTDRNIGGGSDNNTTTSSLSPNSLSNNNNSNNVSFIVSSASPNQESSSVLDTLLDKSIEDHLSLNSNTKIKSFIDQHIQQQQQPNNINDDDNNNDRSILTKSNSMEELNRMLDQLSTETIAKEISQCNLLVNIGRYQEAIETLSNIIQSNPLIPSAYLARGTSFAIIGDLDEAIEDFSKVIELDNTMCDAYKRRGQSLVAQGSDMAAMGDFNQAVALDKEGDSDLFYNRALLFYQMRNYDRALKDFRRVVDLDPTNKLAWNRIGLCLNVQGEPRQAFFAFEKVLELDQEFEAAYTNIGQCWKDLGIYQESLKAFNNALEISPSYSNALHLRGLLFFNSGYHLDAIKDWNEFLKMDSTTIDVRQLRAITLCSIGKFKDSLKDYKIINEMNQIHYSYYQKEILIYTLQHLDEPLESFNIDREVNVYIKTFLCQRIPPTTLIGYQSLEESLPSLEIIKDVDIHYQPTKDELDILKIAVPIGRKLQYDCEGFLPNHRQQLQCGLAVLEIAQTIRAMLKTEQRGEIHLVKGSSSSWCQSDHTFQWRDLYDIAVKWRQYSEPNDPVWWVDCLSPEQFKEGFGSHTPLITGQTRVVRYYPMFERSFALMKQLLPFQLHEIVNTKDKSGGAGQQMEQGVYDEEVDEEEEEEKHLNLLKECLKSSNCKELYKCIKKDFFVLTPCYSHYNKDQGKVMQGTRLTLQSVYPEGFEFAIRTPCTPERWNEYNEELTQLWNDLYLLIQIYNQSNGQQEGEVVHEQQSLLDDISDKILMITYYWYNFMPLTRGSAAVGYTVLLGLFLSIDIDISSNISKGQQPDWDAILSPTPDQFIKLCKGWLYPSRKPINHHHQCPPISNNINSIRKMIQILNQSLNPTI